MKRNRTCPFEEATCSWISKITFWWMNPLFSKGKRKCLNKDDIYDTVSTDKASVVVSRLERNWNEELASARETERSPSFFKTILLTFRTECLMNGIFILIAECMGVLQPYLIGKLLGYFEPDSAMSTTEVYVIAAALGFSSLTKMVIDTWYFFRSHCLDTRMKAGVSCLIYRKVLKVSSLSLQRTTSGKIVNHLSTDIEKLTNASETFHFIWMSPILLIINIYLIYQSVGLACLFMIPVVVSLVPFQSLVGHLMGKLTMKIGARTDKRIYIMNEIITGMKVIKMYCWEKPFSKVIAQLRKAEVKQIWFALILKILNISVPTLSVRILCVAVFTAAWQLKIPISTSKIFSVMGWMMSIKMVVFLYFGFFVERTVQLWASMNRIQSFLMLAEIHGDIDAAGGSNVHYTSSEFAIDIRKMTAAWTNENQSNVITQNNEKAGKSNIALDENDKEMVQTFSLKDIDLKIKTGELIAVVGTVGSGKSSLLMALLGELPAIEGQITANGRIGYVSQQPWVISGTVRNNILFGQNFDFRKFCDVVYVCALDKDIEQMERGDMTLVGERGLLLSGGQKARITLARTINTECDVYLLDDPLGAVDTEVGKHLFNKCICEYLGGKTRILVTHQLQYLKAVDRIIVLKEGRIVSVGTYKDLAGKADFSSLLQDNEQEEGKRKQHDNISTKKVHTTTDESEKEEDIHTGTVGWRVYRDYIASGYPFITVPLILLMLTFAEGSKVIGDWYLAKWGEMQDALISGGMLVSNSTNLSSFSEVSAGEPFMYIFVVSAIPYIIFTVFIGFVLVTTLNTAGKRLHNKMFVKIIDARTRFFDSKPVGRVLNRFARDLGFMDDLIPWLSYLIVQIGSQACAAFIVTCVVNPLLLVPLCPVLVFIVYLRQYATSTTRHLKRIEAVTRSPVFSHVSDTLHGLQTIRALNKSDDFIKEFDKYQDSHTTAVFLYLASFRWFGIRSMLAVGIFFICAIVISLILKDVLGITSGQYGLSLSYILMLASPFEYMVRLSGQLETYMTSVERITAYTKLETEADKTSKQPPPSSWPELGQINFKNLSLKYVESSTFVLRDFNCTIEAKQKVGIVGRTGAGKSSIIAALLRLAEPTGSITIDTVDIQTIGLHELRAKISVIPQDPILFGGTLRYNLDPFEEYEDVRLWDTLEQVQLKSKVEGLTGQLYAEMSEGGKNFSVGQRQLVCLARAVLHNNKILILDEATANVDEETDEIIQRTIRKRFKDCTVLTIAHRLHTIMDSDRVMVLDNGLLKEFDIPYKLLRFKNGYFRKLVDQTGQAQALALETIAEEAYNDMICENEHL